VLHRAGCEALGFACEPHALRTPPAELAERLRDLAERGFRGCNLTHPLKEHAIDQVEKASVAAERAHSVNTIAFRPEGWWGETTDGPGFLDLLRELGREPADQHVLLLGAGGAARSLALALEWAGCRDVRVSSRRPAGTRYAWGEGLDPRFLGWRSSEEDAALREATLVVNCTPLSGQEPPVPAGSLAVGTLAIDLTYARELTPWVSAAREAGLHAVDGLGLLVHQARRSLSLWLGREVPVEPLAAAVGWPR
jgi:shikimate dehydrogenase